MKQKAKDWGLDLISNAAAREIAAAALAKKIATGLLPKIFGQTIALWLAKKAAEKIVEELGELAERWIRDRLIEKDVAERADRYRAAIAAERQELTGDWKFVNVEKLEQIREEKKKAFSDLIKL